MPSDPDIPIASIETANANATVRRQSSMNFRRNPQPSTSPVTEQSPSRTPFKTPRSRAGTPDFRPVSRSPSVASLRNEPPSRLDKRRSIPNLSTSAANALPHQPQFRRASSNLNPLTPTRTKSAMSSPPIEKPKVTAASVATSFFREELEGHKSKSATTIVFTHDACYGHRYSRPRSTKAQLGSIVERPERIHATLLGASTAYVMLGDRHKDGKHGPSPYIDSASIANTPFIFRKTSRSMPLSHPAVAHVHGSKWMEELQIMCDTAEAKLAMGGKELSRPVGYGKDDKGQNLPALHTGDLYLAAESLAALQGCLGGVCDAVDTIFSTDARRAFVCIRPPGHHCSSNVPSGFCWLNNVHVGITYAAMSHGLTHAAIIDFDLHHGDGSQTIAWDHNRAAQTLPKNAASHKKTPIGYYSLHDINSYPCEMGDEDKVRNASTCLSNAHGQSIWNVHLESWQNLDDFWKLYETRYKVLLEKARKFLREHSDRLKHAGQQPKSAIFLSAGFDASQWESEFMQRHNVNVPTDFYARFTSDIVELSKEEGLGVDGRIISVLEGGYSDRALTSGVFSHMCGLTYDQPLSHDAAVESLAPHVEDIPRPAIETFNPTWWSQDRLEYLEAIVAGRTPPSPRQVSDKPPGSYSSPTQASTNKMTNVARERHSISARIEARTYLETRPPEPPPEVEWATASFELSKLLIPSDRQTRSCTHEELNAEATKARRERVSNIGTELTAGEVKMQLRDRKAKVAAPANIRASSRTSNRRTTIAAIADLPDPTMRDAVADRPRRRSSAASSVLSSFQDMRLTDGDEAKGDRPLSARSSNTTVGGTVPPAKKPRAPVRRPPSRQSSPRKAKAVPKPIITQPSSQTSSVARASIDSAGQGQSAVATQKDNVDELTEGMKKIRIKLNVTSKDGQEARTKQLEPEKPQKPRTVRKPPVPKLSKSKPAAKPDMSHENESKVDSLTATVQTGGKLNDPSALPSTQGTKSTAGTPSKQSHFNGTALPEQSGSSSESTVRQTQPFNPSAMDTTPFFEPEFEDRMPVDNRSNVSGSALIPTVVPHPDSSDYSTTMKKSTTPPAEEMSYPHLPTLSTQGNFVSNSELPASSASKAVAEAVQPVSTGEQAELNSSRPPEKGNDSIWDIPETPLKSS